MDSFQIGYSPSLQWWPFSYVRNHGNLDGQTQLGSASFPLKEEETAFLTQQGSHLWSAERLQWCSIWSHMVAVWSMQRFSCLVQRAYISSYSNTARMLVSDTILLADASTIKIGDGFKVRETFKASIFMVSFFEMTSFQYTEPLWLLNYNQKSFQSHKLHYRLYSLTTT